MNFIIVFAGRNGMYKRLEVFSFCSSCADFKYYNSLSSRTNDGPFAYLVCSSQEANLFEYFEFSIRFFGQEIPMIEFS